MFFPPDLLESNPGIYQNNISNSGTYLYLFLLLVTWKSPRVVLYTHINTFVLTHFRIQWNLIIKRLDITKPSYNKVILLVPSSLYFFVFYPDIMRNLI